MKVLFLTRRAWPHVGGVERHIYNLSKCLSLKGYKIRTISTDDIKYPEISIVCFSFSLKVKFLGLLYIWYWLFKNRKLILESDIVHCHDVFIWYLPFRFIFPKKPVYTTFHGWEGQYPVPLKNIFLKRLAAKLSWGSIAVGKYIEKWYGVRANYVTYGGIQIPKRTSVKKKKTILYVGRLEYDTGIRKLLIFLDKHKNYSVEFCGDGSLRRTSEKYGIVHGFTDPTPYYKKAEICFAGGYLAALEALSNGCKLMVGWNNSLKRDYWKLSPFLKDDANKWARQQTWDNVSNIYLKLWGLKK